MADKKKTVNKEETKKTTNGKSSTKKSAKKNTSKKEVNNKKVEQKEIKKEEKVTIKEEITENKETKKIKTEEFRIIIIIAFLVFFAMVYLISSIVVYRNAIKAVAKVKELKSSENTSVIYLMKKDCQYCEINKPNMKELKDTYGVDYFEVDVSAIGSERRLAILNELGLDDDKFGTPTLVLTKNNEVLEVLAGVQAFNNMFDTLKSYKIIDENKELYLNYINYKGYKQILKSKTPQILVLTSTTCHFCIEERPILEQIAKEYNVKINWIYLNGAFATQDEYDEFNSSLSWFANNPNWGTPTTLIIQNGAVKSALSGYREKDDIIQFYKQNGLISE